MSGTATRRNDAHGRLGGILSGIAVAVGCVLFLGGFVWGAVVYEPFTVPTGSMRPTVHPGDRVLGRRLDGGTVRRGDIVVFTDPVWGDVPLVKRVVGVGGDTVSCCDRHGRLVVDGTSVTEPYLARPGRASATGFTVKVPAGRVFLLGDNRDVSEDSRYHLSASDGTVPVSEVRARVEATVWPLGRMRALHSPAAFAALPGGTSPAGPFTTIAWAVAAGVLLIFGGAAWGPVSNRFRRRDRGTARLDPVGESHG